MKNACVCDHCGLCCRHLIVEADAIDVLREPQIEQKCPLGKRAQGLSILDACWILTQDGSCPFLRPESRCGIYPTRPDNCVAFVAGSPQCQQIRKEHGHTPLASQPVADDIVAEILHASLAENLEGSGAT
jgi:Fe-S-cluster containining protein